MRTRAIHLKAAVAGVLGLVAALAFASPAAAAGELELSDDGVTYGSVIATPLFDTAPVLVPTDSASAAFWVRNASTVSGYLRITLANASWGTAAYASSLSVSASVPSTTGTAVPLTSTGCSIMLRGVLLAPGEEVEVTTIVAMADQNGSSGQSSWAAFDLGVTLTESAGMAASPDCSTPTTPVVVVRPPRAAGAPAAETPPVEAEPEPEPEPEPDPETPIDEFIAVLTNTLANFDPSALAAATASVPAGAALFFIVGRTRRALDKYREEGE